MWNSIVFIVFYWIECSANRRLKLEQIFSVELLRCLYVLVLYKEVYNTFVTHICRSFSEVWFWGWRISRWRHKHDHNDPVTEMCWWNIFSLKPMNLINFIDPFLSLLGHYVRSIFNISLGLLLAYLSIPIVQNLMSSHQVMNTSFDSLRIVNTYGAFGR